jgi:glyoxylase-like metal-dependent hydrolase (beta-lactamase superfamily II)
MMDITNRNFWATLKLVGLLLILVGCSATEEGSRIEASDAPQPPGSGGVSYGMTNIEGALYRAGIVSGGGGHTTVLLITPEGVILADPINHGFSKWLKAELAEQFNTQVEYVIYSHHHPDHASGGSTFADTATFVGHENMAVNVTKIPSNAAPMDSNGNGSIEREEATGGTANNFDRSDANGDGTLSAAELNATIQPLDLTYRDQLTISLGGSSVEIYHTPPAHSDDMSVLLFPAERTVFAVDFLQINRLPGGLTGFLAGYPVEDYEAAISVVSALDFDTIVQGHSEVTGDKSDVDAFAQLLRTAESEVAASIANGLGLEETLELVMLPEYSGWLLYETRREALVSDMYRFLSQQ